MKNIVVFLENRCTDANVIKLIILKLKSFNEY